MSKHTVKRDGFGGYTYRGFKIERVPRFHDESKFSHWNIINQLGCCDESANTLRECRYWIDKMWDNQAKA